MVTISVSVDGATSDHAGPTKDFKCTLAALQAASEPNASGISSSPLNASQDVLPPLRNPPLLESSEDLASLSNLNEPSGALFFLEGCADSSVLHAIATRYEAHQPYTYSGIVLVSAQAPILS